MTSEKISEFDSLCSNDEISVLKILTFYLKNPLKNLVTIYILLMQINTYCSRKDTCTEESCKCHDSPHYFFEEIEPYCSHNQNLQQLNQLFKQMEQIKDIMEFTRDMQSLSEDGVFPFSDSLQKDGIDLESLQSLVNLMSSSNTQT